MNHFQPIGHLLKHTSPAIIILVLNFCFFGCGKDKEEESKPPIEITIGDVKGMYVDSTVRELDPPYYSGEIMNIDLDRDDSADLRLVVAIYGSPGLGIYNISQLESLNPECSIFGIYTSDTVFLRQYHSFASDEYNHYHIIRSKYNCRKTSDLDVISEVKTDFHGLDLLPGTKLNYTDTFACDTLSFLYSWSVQPYSHFENDTVYVSSSEYHFDCHSIPFGRDVYLGLKLGNTKPRLGWIKLFIHSATKITFKEFAIGQGGD